VLFVSQRTEAPKLQYANPVFISLSTLANIIFAVLIVSRLIYHRRCVRNALGVQHGSPYTNIITMCVESSALMVIVGSLYVIGCFVPEYWTNLMLAIIGDIIPHIFVGGLELNDF
jgi:hypothetical protein